MEGRIIAARVLYYSPLHYSPYFLTGTSNGCSPNIILSFHHFTPAIFRLRENNSSARFYYSPPLFSSIILLHYSPYFLPADREADKIMRRWTLGFILKSGDISYDFQLNLFTRTIRMA